MSIIYINPYRFAAGYDPDAQDFINRVIAADVAAGNTSGLEVGVQDAYNTFFVGCKADGTFSALKASCILAGARTLSGALVPLLSSMPTPTPFNFNDANYNRKAGLAGDGSTKYLDSNRANNADPQNSKHLAVFVSTQTSAQNTTLIGQALATGSSHLTVNNAAPPTSYAARVNGPGVANIGTLTTGFVGLNRSASTGFLHRSGGSTSPELASISATPASGNILVFGGVNFYAGRLTFYSIGESLSLALLDARVSTLMSALAAAIP
jgi:hypothetical protein